MELENDVEVNAFTAFGFFAFNNRFGMTYELPLAQEIDYSDVDEFKNFDPGFLPPAGPLPGAPGGLPIEDLEPDGNVTGMGDLGLRFFLRPRQWEWSYMEDTKNFSVMPLIEFTVPTATDDLLGGEALIMSPGFALVFDMPFKKPPLGLGFIAMMNFYDFDAFKDKDRPDTQKYRGRWFWMQPLSKPAFVNSPGDKSFHRRTSACGSPRNSARSCVRAPSSTSSRAGESTTAKTATASLPSRSGSVISCSKLRGQRRLHDRPLHPPR